MNAATPESSSSGPLTTPEEDDAGFYRLRLYVAGQTPKSLTAMANLKKVCEQHLAGRYEIEVIDLMQNPRLAAGDQILAIPTLVRRLPSPLHLAPLLLGMRHFSFREKIALALGMVRLARVRGGDADQTQTARRWLESAGQPARVIDLFWQPVLESALGESIDLVSVAAARKVAVDGFLAHREAADLYVPTKPLGELFGDRLAAWLAARGVGLQAGRTVTGFSWAEEKLAGRKDAVPFRLDAELKAAGATYKKALRPMAAKVVVDGTLVTGQNPTSAQGVGEAVVKLLATM